MGAAEAMRNAGTGVIPVSCGVAERKRFTCCLLTLSPRLTELLRLEEAWRNQSLIFLLEAGSAYQPADSQLSMSA